jgi:hypothetical protein
VNKLPGFLDVQNANLFVMYAKARFQIKFEQTKSYMVPIFCLIISSGSMFDLIQLLNHQNYLLEAGGGGGVLEVYHAGGWLTKPQHFRANHVE